MTQSDAVVIERTGDVLDIVLNRPDQRNVLSAAMSDTIIEALAGLDESTKLVRLRSRGADFCAGRESPMPAADAQPSAETLRRVVAAPPLALYDALKATPVPVLGVVRGQALGVGCALAGVCDVTLAAADATFQIPEMERDIPPALVMSALLARVPYKTLAYMVLSRIRIDARDALQAGLVSAVVPADELDAQADQLTEVLAKNSAVTLRAIKQFLQLAPQMPDAAVSGFAQHLLATALSTRFQK
ncbi:enoyl-CoA hydratase/isomerase family protein [Paraburkholderia sp. ZP32-5]|uniref:enoyl-CoA hydratase/isomerase family protein n=1 Tax=Paraburkholderia sp. ZP32-5 TaxID=2883245 RepID=UPI001F1ECE4E|nr:enoyl-CoA hydratase/isomerase family protein [Paraburkholderia sp. ZP32-5]